MVEQLVAIGVAFINIIGFILMGYDKRNAKKRSRRIPERRLFTIVVLGGAIGVYFGMRVFRHKTLHSLFKYGVPIMMWIQLLLALYWFGSQSISTAVL
jgi:uncharacterized membrane protein YsdA (DUF1294 family)